MSLDDFPSAEKLPAIFRINGRLHQRITDGEAKNDPTAIRATVKRKKLNGDLEYVVTWFIPLNVEGESTKRDTSGLN